MVKTAAVLDVAERRSGNGPARRAVIDYYDQCRDDYRILWRTDENGTIHFGFFDDRKHGSFAARAVGMLRLVQTYMVGAAAAVTALGAMLTRTAWGRTKSVEWLRRAARGRAARHDVAQARMMDVCARASGMRAGERVIDAGCGIGGSGLWLAAHYGVKVVGLNVQPSHLHEARRRAAIHPAGSRVHFSAQDFTEMGLASGTVDVVWALESVCHCADKLAFVAESYRVLRPGGRLMVADFFQPREDVAPEHQESMRTWTRGWALPDLAAVPVFHRVLSERGFHEVTYRDIGRHVLPSSRRLYKASLVARPIDLLLSSIGARSRIQRENVRAAYYQYRTLRAGAWTYGVFVATK